MSLIKDTALLRQQQVGFSSLTIDEAEDPASSRLAGICSLSKNGMLSAEALESRIRLSCLANLSWVVSPVIRLTVCT